jgi:hypothetical protein
MNRLKFSVLTLCLIVPALGGCASDDEADPSGRGTISVRAYGESFIEDGIPASDVDDDWAIDFSRFDVSLRDIVVGDVALADPDPVGVHESSNGEGHEVGTVSVAAGDYDSPSFSITQVEVEGSAKKGGVTKTFAWTFDSTTRYARCETSTEVKKNETASFQITVHADHLFYDSLVSEEPQLLFQPLADADADEDGEISSVELSDADIGAYDPGNADIDDLWSFLVAQHRTLGHVDGEGHCEASAD